MLGLGWRKTLGTTTHYQTEQAGSGRRRAVLNLALQGIITGLAFGVNFASLLGFSNVVLPSVGIGDLGGLVGALAARRQ